MDWTIQETLIALASDMGTLSVVRFTGGEYGIAIDGEPMRALYWHGGQLEECVAMAARMAGCEVPRKKSEPAPPGLMADSGPTPGIATDPTSDSGDVSL